MSNAIVHKLTDADRGVDFSEAIQGHVSASVTQRFTCERSRIVDCRRLQLEAAEHIVKDQFGNVYVVFTSKLMDGDVYAVTDWVGTQKPGFPLRLVKEFKSFGGFSDNMLGYLQDKAFVAFGRATEAILKGRQAAKLPMISSLPSGLPAVC